MQANQTPPGARWRKSSLLWMLCLTAFGIITTTGFVGTRGAQVVSKAGLSAQDPRPLAKAIQLLETKSGAAITYEDPLYIHASEITDVTAKVRRDINSFRLGEAPKVLIPKGGALSIEYNTIPGTERPVDSAAVVQQLVNAHNASRNAGRFRVERSGLIIHVIPVEFKNSTGESATQQSVLDAVISLPGEERSGVQTLQAICDAVSRETQTKVVLGTIPLNLFIRHPDQKGWENQKARDVLVDLLGSSGNGVNLSWRLLYGPGTKMYVLNIHAVPATR